MANELSLLKPIVESDTAASQIHRQCQELKDEIRQLRHDCEDLIADKERLQRSIEHLRKTLSPFHRALRILFGEIEDAIGEETLAPTFAPSGAALSNDPRWEHFKKQFPGVPAAMIDTLLIHGEVGMTNLANLMKRAYGTTKNAAYKLNAAGAVSIVRGSVSLKR